MLPKLNNNGQDKREMNQNDTLRYWQIAYCARVNVHPEKSERASLHVALWRHSNMLPRHTVRCGDVVITWVYT